MRRGKLAGVISMENIVDRREVKGLTRGRAYAQDVIAIQGGSTAQLLALTQISSRLKQYGLGWDSAELCNSVV
jgi:hypothetical protein